MRVEHYWKKKKKIINIYDLFDKINYFESINPSMKKKIPQF